MAEAGASGGTVCLLNGGANSRGARDAEKRLRQLLVSRVPGARLQVVQDGCQISSIASKAVEDGARIVVAAGGDGTINAVAGALTGTETALGVLPMGTLNHFAKDVGIPLDLESAVDNLSSGVIRQLDLGEVNGQVFLNNSSIGLYPKIVRGRDYAQAGGVGKWRAFAQASFYALRSYSKFHVMMTPAGGPAIEERTPFVFIGNNVYALSGARLGQRSRLDAGKLWVHGAPNTSRVRLLWLALRAFLGVNDARAWHCFEAEELSISLRRKRVRVSFDGEVGVFQAPLRYRIRPLALKVIVPDMPSAVPD